VCARRIAADGGRRLRQGALPGLEPQPASPASVVAPPPPERVRALQQAMSAGAGVLRSAETLERAAAELVRLAGPPGAGTAAWEHANLLTVATAVVAAAVRRGAGTLERADAELVRLAGPPGAGTAAWEYANLLTVATAVVAAAYARTETRGAHWREDCPETDDAWRGHLRGALRPDGS